MARRGENIFLRKDGRWEARYIKGYDLTGRIRYGYCYAKSYREVKEKAREAKEKIQSSAALAIRRSSCKFSELCDQWLQLKKAAVKESTYIKYELCIRRHIAPRIGGYYPHAITTEAIDQMKKDLLTEECLSPKMVKDVLMILHSVIKYIMKEYPGILPAVEIFYPREERREMRVLSLDEQRRFIAYLQEDMDTCKFGTLFALLTGIRLGELCAMRWENVSLERRTIYIGSTLQRLKDTNPDEENEEKRTRVVIGDTKSMTSNRTIPMQDSVVELCRAIHPRDPDAYLLTGTDQYMEPRTLQYRLERYVQDCNLEGVHFHTLRHTFATRCVEVGFELKSLSEVLGHSSTSVTMERYIHSSLELKRDNMSKLSALGL